VIGMRKVYSSLLRRRNRSIRVRLLQIGPTRRVTSTVLRNLLSADNFDHAFEDLEDM
jgi:hypothetical protein